MQVDLDGCAGLFGEPDGFNHRAVGHGVGCMGANGRHDVAIVFPAVDKVGALAQVFLGSGTPRRREVEQRKTDLRTNARIVRHLSRNFREEIHVRKRGGSRTQHLGHGQLGAIGNELLADKATFGRPDMVIQPGHQRKIVCHAPEQAHGRVAVHVDQAGHDDVVRKINGFPGSERSVRLFLGNDCGKAVTLDNHCIMLKYRACRLNRDQPARVDANIGCGDSVCRHLSCLTAHGAELPHLENVARKYNRYTGSFQR